MTVLVSLDGESAIERAQRVRPDIVLMDAVMPGMDGFETCRLLRRYVSCPIVIASARSAEIDRVVNELNAVREMLRSEGERVQREITSYASLSQAAMSSMKVMTDSLAQWNAPASQSRQSNS